MKVNPSVEDILYEPETKCSKPQCSKSFKTFYNLQWHLNKHHGIKTDIKPKFPTNAEFHCPVNGCIYTSPSKRYFSNFQRLKQHYMKVHAEKKYICNKCKKAYPRSHDLKRHELVCETVQKCSCGYSYSTHEALLTHARRYDHDLPNEFLPKKKRIKLWENKSEDKDKTHQQQVTNTSLSSSSPVDAVETSSKKPANILPKSAPINCLPLPTIAAIALSELSACSVIPIITGKATIATQTIALNIQETKNKHVTKGHKCSKIKRNKNSAQTQTSAVNFVSRSKGSKLSCGKLIGKMKKKRVNFESTESQTNLSSLQKQISRANSENASSKADKGHSNAKKIQNPIWECLDKDEMEPLHISTDVMFSNFNLHKNTSATQTSPRVIDSQTNTESMELLDQFCNCEHISQSSNLILEDLLESPIACQNYNAVHTQTDTNFQDMIPLSDYLLETETSGETLNSETQTTENFLDTIDYSQLFTNMETQTGDNLFPLGLSFSNIHTQTSWNEQCDSSTINENKGISTETQTNEMLESVT